MIDLKFVECPKCHKKHFMKTAMSSDGNFFDLLKGFGMNDGVYRVPPKEEYINGELQHPEAFVPSPSKTHFECLECGCHFSIETTYHYNSPETYALIDEDKLKAEREAAWKKAQEEREKQRKKEEAKKAAKRKDDLLKCGDSIAVTSANDVLAAKNGTLAYVPSETIDAINNVTRIGNGSMSEIDLGGFKILSNIHFSDDQIKNMKETFGWDVKNVK